MTATLVVRKDGAINLRRKNRHILGIRPGMAVNVSIDKGKAIIVPVGYTCQLCEGTGDKPLNSLGICKKCDEAIVELIKTGKCSTIPTAMTQVSKMRKAKVVRK